MSISPHWGSYSFLFCSIKATWLVGAGSVVYRFLFWAVFNMVYVSPHHHIEALVAMAFVALKHSNIDGLWRGNAIPRICLGFVSPTWPLTTMSAKPAYAIGQQPKNTRLAPQLFAVTFHRCPTCGEIVERRIENVTRMLRFTPWREREREGEGFGSVGGLRRKQAAGVALIMTYRLKLDDSFAELPTFQNLSELNCKIGGETFFFRGSTT